MIRTRSLFVLAFIAAALTACDAGGESDRLTGPQADLVLSNDISVVTTTETASTSTVVAVVGREGGQIQNGEHILSIPKRAVPSATEFTFTVVGGNNIHVDLTAKTVATGAAVTVFSSNLTLKLSYRTAQISDPSRLVVAWLVDGTVDGKKQAVPSYVDTYNKYILGSLSHFSDYVAGWN